MGQHIHGNPVAQLYCAFHQLFIPTNLTHLIVMLSCSYTTRRYIPFRGINVMLRVCHLCTFCSAPDLPHISYVVGLIFYFIPHMIQHKYCMCSGHLSGIFSLLRDNPSTYTRTYTSTNKNLKFFSDIQFLFTHIPSQEQSY